MKKIFLLSLAILFAFGLYAQEKPDGVIMKDGKMMVVKDGKISVMDKDLLLSNGTKIMSNGTIVKKDGSKIMMKEGDYKDMSGNVVKNMYLVPKEKVEKDTLR